MDIERIELKLLQCLIALVEERSVTRAAERLGLSQPRMSNALRRLRELSADPLLVRAGQRLVPTDRAIAIASRVQAGLEEIAAALADQRSFDPSTSERAFAVMMSGYSAVTLLPEVLRRIRPIAPAIKLFNQPISHTDLHRLLDEGVCDLAFGYLRALHANLRISTCYTDYAVCIAGTEHWGDADSITLDAFVAARHVSMGDSPSSISTPEVVFDRELQALGTRRVILAHSQTPAVVARMVASTDLLGIMSARLADDYIRQLPIKTFPLPLPLPFFDVSMVWHERNQNDDAHAWLRGQFRKVASDAARFR